MALKHSKEIAAVWADYQPSGIDARLAMSRNIAHILLPPHIAKSRNIFLRIWDAITPPSRAFRMVVCWLCMVGQTRRFCREFFPSAKIIICGHFHRSGIWDDGKLLVINTGSYMPPGGALWCEWKGQVLRVGKVNIAARFCSRGALMGVWRIEGSTQNVTSAG
jgi:hypothetical protein